MWLKIFPPEILVLQPVDSGQPEGRMRNLGWIRGRLGERDPDYINHNLGRGIRAAEGVDVPDASATDPEHLTVRRTDDSGLGLGIAGVHRQQQVAVCAISGHPAKRSGR